MSNPQYAEILDNTYIDYIDEEEETYKLNNILAWYDRPENMDMDNDDVTIRCYIGVNYE